MFHQLGRWQKLKQAKPGLVIGVGGCVASQEGSAIRARAPHVDMVFGPQTIHRLPDMVSSAQSQKLRWLMLLSPKLKNSTVCPNHGWTAGCVCFYHGGVQQILFILCCAVYAW